MICPICAVAIESEAGALAKHLLQGHPGEGAIAAAAITVGCVMWPKKWGLVVAVVLGGVYGVSRLQNRGFN